jgi:hypothetical protein
LQINRKPFEKWNTTEYSALEDALQKEQKNNGITHLYTIGLALLALCTTEIDRLKQEKALSCASLLVKQTEKGEKQHYIDALRTRALLRWAFNKSRCAVDDMRYVFQTTNELRDKNDFLYFLTEVPNPHEQDLNLAKQCLIDLESSKRHKINHIDTIGAYHIRFGETLADLHHGLDFVRQAKEKARKDPRRRPVLDAFCSYHEYIYLKRLSKVRKTK